jgi:long-chain acyl-CoA synthetase
VAGTGHSGLLSRRSPSTLSDLIADTERWTDHTFLVQGGRRVSFDDFRFAIAAAGERLRELGIGRGDRVMLFGYHRPSGCRSG